MNIKLEITKETLEKYNEYYFKQYPKRRVAPIEKPIPPSLNRFIAMIRMQQNSLKQKYKQFAIWLAEYYQISGLKLTKATIKYKFYFKDRRRRDFDNLVLTPKLLNDGFVEAGVFVDDSVDILRFEFENYGYDKLNPRVEMTIEYERDKTLCQEKHS